MSKNDGGPAFPVSYDHDTFQPSHVSEAKQLMSGMSLRDYFAAKAMAACISNAPNCSRDIYRIGEHEWLKKQAGFAYFAADAMLEARAK